MSEIRLEPLTEKTIPDDWAVIQKNKDYLERNGEGYPALKNANDYYRYLLDIYGDFQNVSQKRFTIKFQDQSVGQIGLHSLCINNFTPQAEIFYWVDEKYQGKGIVTRACYLLQQYAFEYLGLELLIIHCLIENVKSAQVAFRAGFDYEGITKYNKEYKKFIKTIEQYQREQTK